MQHLRPTFTILALLSSAVLALSCSDNGGGTTDPNTAQITVAVHADGAARTGVELELYAAGSETELASQTTGAGGTATFSDLEAGSYDVEVLPPADLELDAGEDDRQTVQVTEGQSASVTFELVTAADVVEVTLTSDLRFEPAELTIQAGTTVRWRNATDIFHTITPDGHSEWERATVNQQGDTFLHTFDTADEFPYYCEPHRNAGMTGSITVQ